MIDGRTKPWGAVQSEVGFVGRRLCVCGAFGRSVGDAAAAPMSPRVMVADAEAGGMDAAPLQGMGVRGARVLGC